MQYVKIFHSSPYPKEIKAIKNIEDFSLTQDFELKFDHDLILQDAFTDFFSQLANVVDNCGLDFDCIKTQVVDVWNGISDSEKEEKLRNATAVYEGKSIRKDSLLAKANMVKEFNEKNNK